MMRLRKDWPMASSPGRGQLKVRLSMPNIVFTREGKSVPEDRPPNNEAITLHQQSRSICCIDGTGRSAGGRYFMEANVPQEVPGKDRPSLDSTPRVLAGDVTTLAKKGLTVSESKDRAEFCYRPDWHAPSDSQSFGAAVP
jgi:hypothetical protein